MLATCTAGTFDGVRIDHGGRIWAAAGDGLHCFDPDGTLIGKLLVPETVANFTFGGPRRNRLFICATSSLYSIMVNVTAAVPARLLGRCRCPGYQILTRAAGSSHSSSVAPTSNAA